MGILTTNTNQNDLISVVLNVNLTLLEHQAVQSPGR